MSSYLRIESLVSLLIFCRPLVIRSLDIFLYRAMVGRLFLMTFGGTSLGCCAGGRPLCLVRLLLMRCHPPLFLLLFSLILAIILDLFLLLHVVKERSELESRFDERVQAAIEYARTIKDFNKLIDPRTLAHHCLGPEPSLYVLSVLDREEKKRKLPLYTGWPFFFLSFSFLKIPCFLWCRDDVQI